MKMYLTITPNGITVNVNGTSRRTGTALFAAADFAAVPHGPKPLGRKRRF